MGTKVMLKMDLKLKMKLVMKLDVFYFGAGLRSTKLAGGRCGGFCSEGTIYRFIYIGNDGKVLYSRRGGFGQRPCHPFWGGNHF
jgi:hypothetical protein